MHGCGWWSGCEEQLEACLSEGGSAVGSSGVFAPLAPGAFVAECGLVAVSFSGALEFDDPPAPHGLFDAVRGFASGEGSVDASGLGEGVEVGVGVEEAGVCEVLESVGLGWGSVVPAGVGVSYFDAESPSGEQVVSGRFLAGGEGGAEAVAGGACGRGWGARWDRL